MPLNLSFTHLAVVVVVALIVLGPDKLPDAIRTLARGVGELRRMTDGVKQEVRGTFGEYTEPITELVHSVRGIAATAAAPVAAGMAAAGAYMANGAKPAIEDPAAVDGGPLAPGIPSLGRSSGLASPGPPLPELPSLSPDPPAPGTFEIRE